MSDFVKYIVAELKSKRLSKADAIGLIKQFSSRPAQAGSAAMHPLVQANTSDLYQQSYTTRFTGEEFFLRDHQIQGRKVLPGVAYLEMARAAVLLALPGQDQGSQLELRHVAWAQPIVYPEQAQVSIALFQGEQDEVEFEVYSGNDSVHFQGSARFHAAQTPVAHDLAQIAARMTQGQMSGADMYAQIAQIGIELGPSQQGVQRILQGEQELLVEIALPELLASSASEYVLHPSVMDSTLQAAMALIVQRSGAGQAPIPFALESLHIYAACSQQMRAWVRYAAGSRLDERVVKLDIDLCDANGKLCVQMRGFSSRLLQHTIGSAKPLAASASDIGCLLAVPEWQPSSLAATSNIQYSAQQVLLCDLSASIDNALLHQAQLDHNLAQRYTACALAAFAQCQSLLANKEQGKVLLQIVLPDDDAHLSYRGLASLLGTATQENPKFIGQLLIVPAEMASSDLQALLQAEAQAGSSGMLRYANGQRFARRWLEAASLSRAAPVWRDDGVYLITGGMGGLGLLFARDILAHSSASQIILSGRQALSAEKASILSAMQPANATRLHYRQLDLADGAQVTQFVAGLVQEFGQLHGILHSAGMIADNFVLKKTEAEISEVFAPKVAGTDHLDQASQGLALDFFALFSSISALFGNVGQADYASANGFMDGFAAYRNQLRQQQQRQGNCFALNWPLWAEGGMQVDDANREALARNIGMQAMSTEQGLQAFYQAATQAPAQMMVVAGELARLRQVLLGIAAEVEVVATPAAPAASALDAASLAQSTIDFLRQQFSLILKLAPQKIDPQAALERYGIDSILAMDLTAQLEKTFGTLPKTLFFEHHSIAELSSYFLQEQAGKLHSLFSSAAKTSAPPVAKPVALAAPVAAAPAALSSANLAQSTQDFLRKEFAVILKLAAQKIDPQAALERYGIDSILAMDLTAQLEKTFGTLPKTLFFEHHSISELCEYFLREHDTQLRAMFAPAQASSAPAPAPVSAATPAAPPSQHAPSRRSRRASSSASSSPARSNEAIAIVGLSGRYPEAENLQEYWNNLRDGKDCIVEVPLERWDWREYYSEDRTRPGSHYSKWGGFIKGIDEFDPLFFNIPPVDAELIDPQERLFLQHAWMAVEDAGYTRAALQIPHRQLPGEQAGQVGVYVGVMYGEYQLFGAEASLQGERFGIPQSYASIANRVSYILNLHGPSMTLDSMCSSSLTAIHLACLDLKQGRTDLAIAGGVNITPHPNKYLILSAGQFISGDGHCQSFGEGGDGYIPGEGVGAVILKRLSEAQQDGNHIYGVIKGSALNHGGKTNGYTVPSPKSQASLISMALKENGIDARHISYIEAHGTGTKLGDPIEIAALSQVFRQYSQQRQYCALGSAKSNIGHCESAAGIAGLTKVLLQMQHQMIVPSLHSKVLNPHINFADSPFIVNQDLIPWQQLDVDGKKVPRLAGISSFGAGGSNAHLIIEEYAPPLRAEAALEAVIIALSARTEEQLRQKSRDLLAYLQRPESSQDVQALAYTLQVGREAMDYRLALVVESRTHLQQQLQAYQQDPATVEQCFVGIVEKESMSLLSQDDDMMEAIAKWVARKKLAKLAELWVKGWNLDWRSLYAQPNPALLSLPTYPFARNRYWIGDRVPRGSQIAASAQLHPLLQTNISDFFAQRYVSQFSGKEFFLADHQLGSSNARQKILPGVAYLEMARAAADAALPSNGQARVLEIRNVAWSQAIVVQEIVVQESQTTPHSVQLGLAAQAPNLLDFVIETDGEDGQKITHCQGQIEILDGDAPPALDLASLQAQMQGGQLLAQPLYEAYAAMGLHYGPAFRCVSQVQRGQDQLLAQLQLPSNSRLAQYVLHPGMLDSALQSALGFLEDFHTLPEFAAVPFALDALTVYAPCSERMFVWLRRGQQPTPGGISKIDLDLCDEAGNLCVQFKGLSSRSMPVHASAQTHGVLLAQPSWQILDESEATLEASSSFVRQQVLLCGVAGLEPAVLANLAPHRHWRQLPSIAPETALAAHYQQRVLEVFAEVQAILQSAPQQPVLLQVVAEANAEHTWLAGLTGLLASARQENPQLYAQIILLEDHSHAQLPDFLALLQQASRNSGEVLLRVAEGRLRALRWQENNATTLEANQAAYQDQGVYLITGGTGGLGLLFAHEIVRTTQGAVVILTGRAASCAPEILAQFANASGLVVYRQLDLLDLAQVSQLVNQIVAEFGKLNGVLHSAGMTRDAYLIHKSSEDVATVLAPKVAGTLHLDLATASCPLDFMVYFSSVAAALGNPAQGDYAAANGFMDHYAAYRQRLVASGARHGKTLSINWPLWQEGGMQLDAAKIAILQQASGMQPLQTAHGMQAFVHSLASASPQSLVLEGHLARLRRAVQHRRAAPVLASAPAKQISPAPVSASTAASTDSNQLLARTLRYLSEQFSSLLRIPPEEVDPKAPMEQYGMDSVLAMKLTNELERSFGSLSKTLFFEYQTLASLAGYLMQAFPAILREKTGMQTSQPKLAARQAAARHTPALPHKMRFGMAQAAPQLEVAIIGMAGRYPMAHNVEQFWQNLQSGRDCISEIPPERWDAQRFYHAGRNQAGKTYCKWGGFLPGVDLFDALFFNISPKEAELIDPQERLFLETVWETIEDAGYSKDAFNAQKVGVYVGAMWGQYELFGVNSEGAGIPSSSFASIANRVSYFFNFRGPSMALDTMCSSSLTAIHLASEELRKGALDLAIAGGVNVSIHPNKYLNLAQGNFASTDGRCRSFGEGGDGYVPGEGVGAVLLKPLHLALQDGDQIYAIVKGSGINHGGKTNGYTVPNPLAQSDLIIEVMNKSNVAPGSIAYMETHGTGTSLGDPIEMTGLVRAFAGVAGGDALAKQSCPIGSVKSNIGHLESAAGIAAISKVLLQFKHQQLAPSLHAEVLNPHIAFAETPFFVQTKLSDWQATPGQTRRVGISSFGAGGANAHVLLEEFIDPRPASAPDDGAPQALLLSAKNRVGLQAYAEKMILFFEQAEQLSLADICYTSQVGRTAMAERLVVIATSKAEMIEKLRQWQQGATGIVGVAGVLDSRSKDSSARSLIEGEAGLAFLALSVAQKDLPKLAKLWVSQVEIAWAELHQQARRVSLPSYPFARERYWISVPEQFGQTAAAVQAAPARTAAAKEMLYYRSHWQVTPLRAASTQAPAGRILFIGASSAQAADIAQCLNGGELVQVSYGAHFQQIGNAAFSVNPANAGDFAALFDALADALADAMPSAVVLCQQPANELDNELDAQLQQGVYALHAISQEILKRKPKHEVKILVVADSKPQELQAPLHQASAGYLKSLALENPKLSWKVVSLPASGAWAQQLLHELHEGRAGEVRFEGEVRLCKQLQRFVPEQKIASAFKQHGVYVITGGLGGLGYLFSEYLVKQYRARLVLTGRSALNSEQQAKLDALCAHSAVLYVQADIADAAQAASVVAEAKNSFGALNGIFHSAGVLRDGFVLNKTQADLAAVLAAKVQGTVNLDAASQHENLDLFVLFSSVAGALGNLGQADYAYANHFLDAFAAEREQLRIAGERSGKSLAINWPLWLEGGMHLAASDIALIEQRSGMSPLPSERGLAFCETLLASEGMTHALTLYGDAAKIAAYLAPKALAAASADAASAPLDQERLLEVSENYLKDLLSKEIKLPAARIDSAERFESFGVDSMMISRINAELERDLGELPKTLFYEYATIEELAAYLRQEVPAALQALLNLPADSAAAAAAATVAEVDAAQAVQAAVQQAVSASAAQIRLPLAAREQLGQIAIIGVHGQFPQADNLQQYWENLREGRDVVDVVPAARWDLAEFYDADPERSIDGKMYCKWGGFLGDFDQFDASFFAVTSEDARLLDPQERLFIQSVWAVLEDAGYTRESIKQAYPKARSADVGVFVGVTTNSYHMHTTDEWLHGNMVTPGSLPWSIANRVSYFFDFQGPSLPIDTACSSSLVAMHLAVESLQRQECQIAVAGGVNLYLHPAKYVSFCRRKMLAEHGKCRSFGAGDDGFIPGEGVGSFLLKPLALAERDHDHIYGVIAASGYEHAGRANGYSAPNPNSQAVLIERTLGQAGIHAESINYVEGHGTGTQLGDNLEVVSMTQAFRKHTALKRYCPLGSVKANMGHAESAAGVAGVAKILLQFAHKEIAPTLHSAQANPNIDFENSPFYLQHQRSPWHVPAGQVRRAMINSFGAGGVNACIVLDEYATPEVVASLQGPQLVILSAKNQARLQEMAARLLAHVNPATDLRALSYTLQIGREAMDERLAVVVSSVAELQQELRAYLAGQTSSNLAHAQLDAHRRKKMPKAEDKAKALALFEASDLAALAKLWLAGQIIVWEELYHLDKPYKISLPSYPFAKERYWLNDRGLLGEGRPRTAGVAQLHPLVSHNVSTLKQVAFISNLSGKDYYGRDHQVGSDLFLPGAAYLEMACISGTIAGEHSIARISDIVWIAPLKLGNDSTAVKTLLKANGEVTEYSIISYNQDNEAVVHAEGRLHYGAGRHHTDQARPSIAIAALKKQANKTMLGVDCYRQFTSFGFSYGPSFQTIQEMHIGANFVLAKLSLAQSLLEEFEQYILHPCLLDGALQAVIGMATGDGDGTSYLPFALGEVEIVRPLLENCYVHVVPANTTSSNADVKQFNITLLSESGEVLVALHNFYVRALRNTPAANKVSA